LDVNIGWQIDYGKGEAQCKAHVLFFENAEIQHLQNIKGPHQSA